MIDILNKLNEADRNNIFELWNTLYPSQVTFSTYQDFESFLEASKKQLNVVHRNDQGILSGWLMVFERDNKRNFVMLISENHQAKGVGRLLVDEMKKREDQVQGWIVTDSTYVRSDGRLYKSPLGFYKKLGFSITNDQWTKKDLRSTKIIWSKSREGSL